MNRSFFTENMRLKPLTIVVYAVITLLIVFFSLLFLSPRGAFTLTPNNQLFVWHLIWLELLFNFLWFDGFVMPIYSMLRKEDRVLVGSGYRVQLRRARSVAGISVLLFLASVVLPSTGVWQTLTVSAQILVMAFYLVCAMRNLFAQRQQLAGLEKIDPSLPLPADLALTIGAVRRNPALDPALRAAMKNLAEQLQYSLSSRGKIAGVPQYRELCDAVRRISEAAAAGNLAGLPEEVAQAAELVKVVKQLCR